MTPVNQLTGLLNRMSSHLLIIGAGPKQLPGIALAKKRGFQVTATDQNPDAVGFMLADHYGIVSTRCINETVSFAAELHARHPFHGVMTVAAESAIVVAEVAQKLDLPGLASSAAHRATHKVERQECFAVSGVPAPRFASANSLEGALAMAELLGWPFVIKPADSAGSRGVQLVRNAAQLESAIEEIRTISKDHFVLMEEYLEGTEHSIEGIVLDGEVIWTGFSDRNYDKKHIYAPYFLEDGDTLPTALSDVMLDRVKAVSTQAVRALGIDFGPVKGDILIDSEGPKMLEMAARLSGDYFCDVTVPLHNGINLLEVAMDQALGMPVDDSRLQPRFNRGVALRYVWPKPGIVRRIEGLETARALPGVHFVQFEPRWKDLAVGTRIEPISSMGERVAAVMAHAETRAEAIAIAEEAVSMIRIDTE